MVSKLAFKFYLYRYVEGRKLTDITSDPTTGPLRAKLVQTLLNSYMVQFLETGFLHADPHPGGGLYKLTPLDS
jgi:predicted unusual protein kinase regulating ubiquinone biosynthesis (AarF/ABC1/UbiB family)